LDHGASPGSKNDLAVFVAIRRKDMSLVKMLVERDGSPRQIDPSVKGKRRKMEDRVDVRPEMVEAAVKCGAMDIAKYFTTVKGCVPDMKTLQLMARKMA
jgi:hypothetical protein